ncbi:E3 ubiquitin-protein ligase RNF123-like isoform X2 [Lineus longissimus]|uniref:E3 ubiquitin-protein ligase RNF123-like isoform X2 n=1 Tax=Lineus longissimus TaxID=88925 RepID=UPI00315DCDE3
MLNLTHSSLIWKQPLVIFGSHHHDPLGFHNLCEHIDKCLDEAANGVKDVVSNSAQTGRIGPDVAVLDIGANVGTLFIEADKLGVTSHSNFSTIRANTCVCQGKWIYEVMLGSKGVMQLGWSTLDCKFSQEEGVGDTSDSYAYDGNRLRKWNVKTQKYGEAWLTGDVISCGIDCDKGTISFYRNGRGLGKAFTSIRSGKGLAYFPAVSLSMGENLRVNFGATPLRYPIEGYRPLQEPPHVDLAKAQVLFGYLDRLLIPTLMVKEKSLSTRPPLISEPRSPKSSCLLVAAHILEKLAPLLRKAYIVEDCLLKFMLKFCDARSHSFEQPYIEKTLDLIWSFLQDFEYRTCLEHLVVTLLAAYRFSPVLPDFKFQKMYLILTLAVLRHDRTRRFLLKHVLFDKIKFPIFLHVKPPDDTGLAEVIPTVWWGFPKKDDDEDTVPEDEEERKRREIYLGACQDLREKVAVLEKIQVEILKVLLQMEDNTKGPSSRVIFLGKLREFLKENFDSGRVMMGYNQAPLPVTLCFFHRLLQALRFYWDEYHARNPSDDIPDGADAFVPCHRFFDNTLVYFEGQRLGGLMTHLQKTFKEETHKALEEAGIEKAKDATETMYDRLTGLRSLKLLVKWKYQDKEKDKTAENAERLVTEKASLSEILDGLIMMYHIAAHKQLGKMCTLRETVQEYVNALQETKEKLEKCSDEMTDVREELERAKTVFEEKASEQSRHMAWIIAVIYSQEKQADVYWLHKVVLRTIEVTDAKGSLLAFIPDFYVDVCVNTCIALRTFFHPTVPVMSLPAYTESLKKFAIFLAKYFSDSRIVNTDSKDTIIQTLATFVCFHSSLRAMESIPVENCMNLVRNLLAPYENRSWAQTNWILVRFWKGCGFAFRYTQPPHLTSKSQVMELLNRVCPSVFYQSRVKEYLKSDWVKSVKFLDSLLNQLNWAFSEFVGMLQELQQFIFRRERVFIDNRQLKICSTCFDISVRLLRVLEMIVTLVPDFFTDWSKSSAESLIARLFQLLCQVLNRVVSQSGVFDNVVAAEMPGMESVDHFPILTSVVGIMAQLIMKGNPKSRECATAALLADPGFQISALEFLFGGKSEGATQLDKKQFNLRKYPKDVSATEVQLVEEMIEYLSKQQSVEKKVTESLDEDELCTICYAYARSCTFKPCGHQSCSKCISRHLLTKKDCFFCKATVDTVEGINGKPAKF